MDETQVQPVKQEILDTELPIQIYLINGFVAIKFGRPTEGFKITKKEAKEFASKLIKVAIK